MRKASKALTRTGGIKGRGEETVRERGSWKHRGRLASQVFVSDDETTPTASLRVRCR